MREKQTGQFLTREEKKSIALAIHQAENKTSGEIRVHIDNNRSITDPLLHARRRFNILKMDRTREHNGILLYIAPMARHFAFYGDSAINEKVGQEFWDTITTTLSDHFLRGDFCLGIIDAVDSCGSILSKYFPHRDDDINELPDDVTES
jgi:uncharacterized membrane protein